MAKKNDSWELFDKAKKDLRIRAIKDPRKKDAYILTFEDKLSKKDSRNVLDMCGEILGKEKVTPNKEYEILFEVKANTRKRKA